MAQLQMETRVSFILAAALAFTATAMVAASAASPEYCAHYAREYAIDTVQPAAAIGLRQSVEDRAYYRCLNQDEDPPLPTASAYYDPSELRARVSSTPPSPLRGQVQPDPPRNSSATAKQSTIASQPQATKLAVPPAQQTGASVAKSSPDRMPVDPVVTGSTGSAPRATYSIVPPWLRPTARTADVAAAPAKPTYKGSGLQPGTAEWAAWCAKYFPRSWDPETGTVVHGSTTTGERVLCK
jgi:hypothetical protein